MQKPSLAVQPSVSPSKAAIDSEREAKADENASKSSEIVSKRVQCDLCKLSYSSEKELTEHLLSLMHHTKLEDKEQNPVHVCTKCSVTCSNMADYRMHIATDKHQKILAMLRGESDSKSPRDNRRGGTQMLRNCHQSTSNRGTPTFNKRIQHLKKGGTSRGKNSIKNRGFPFQHGGFSNGSGLHDWNRDFCHDRFLYKNKKHRGSQGHLANTHDMYRGGQNVYQSRCLSATPQGNQFYEPWGSGAYGDYFEYHNNDAEFSIPSGGVNMQEKWRMNTTHQREFFGQADSNFMTYASNTIPEVWDEQLLEQEHFFAGMDDVHYSNKKFSNMGSHSANSDRWKYFNVQGRKRAREEDVEHESSAKDSRMSVFSSYQNIPANKVPRRQQTTDVQNNKSPVLSSDLNDQTQISFAGSDLLERAERLCRELREKPKESQSSKNKECEILDRKVCALIEKQQLNQKGVNKMIERPLSRDRCNSDLSSAITRQSQNSGLSTSSGFAHSSTDSIAPLLQPKAKGNTLDDIKKSIEKSVLATQEEPQTMLISSTSPNSRRKRCSSTGAVPDIISGSKDVTVDKSLSKPMYKVPPTKDIIKKFVNASHSRDGRLQLTKMLQSRDGHKTAASGAPRSNLQFTGLHGSIAASQNVDVGQDCDVQTIKLEDLSDSVRHQILNLIGEEDASNKFRRKSVDETRNMSQHDQLITVAPCSQVDMIILSDDDDDLRVKVKHTHKKKSKRVSSNSMPRQLIDITKTPKKKKVAAPACKTGLRDSLVSNSTKTSERPFTNRELTRPNKMFSRKNEEVVMCSDNENEVEIVSWSSNMKLGKEEETFPRKKPSCVSTEATSVGILSSSASSTSKIFSGNQEESSELANDHNQIQLNSSAKAKQISACSLYRIDRTSSVKKGGTVVASEIGAASQSSKRLLYNVSDHIPDMIGSSSVQKDLQPSLLHTETRESMNARACSSLLQAGVRPTSLSTKMRSSSLYKGVGASQYTVVRSPSLHKGMGVSQDTDVRSSSLHKHMGVSQDTEVRSSSLHKGMGASQDTEVMSSLHKGVGALQVTEVRSSLLHKGVAASQDTEVRASSLHKGVGASQHAEVRSSSLHKGVGASQDTEVRASSLHKGVGASQDAEVRSSSLHKGMGVSQDTEVRSSLHKGMGASQDTEVRSSSLHKEVGALQDTEVRSSSLHKGVGASQDTEVRASSLHKGMGASQDTEVRSSSLHKGMGASQDTEVMSSSLHKGMGASQDTEVRSSLHKGMGASQDTEVRSSSLHKEVGALQDTEVRSSSLHKGMGASQDTEVRSSSLHKGVGASQDTEVRSSSLHKGMGASQDTEVRSSLHKGMGASQDTEVRSSSLHKEVGALQDTEVRSSSLHKGVGASQDTEVRASSLHKGVGASQDTEVRSSSLHKGMGASQDTEVRSALDTDIQSSLHKRVMPSSLIKEASSSLDEEVRSFSLHKRMRPSSLIKDARSSPDVEIKSLHTRVTPPSLERSSSPVKEVGSSSLPRGKKSTSLVKDARSSPETRVRPSSPVAGPGLTLDTGVLSTSLVRQSSPVKEIRSLSLHSQKRSTSPGKDGRSSPDTEVRSFSLNKTVRPSSVTEASSTPDTSVLSTSLVRQYSPIKGVKPSSLHSQKNSTSPGKDARSFSLNTRVRPSSPVNKASSVLDTGILSTSLMKEVQPSSLHRHEISTSPVKDARSSPDTEVRSFSLNTTVRPSSSVTEASSTLDTGVLSTSLGRQCSPVEEVWPSSLRRLKNSTSPAKDASSSLITEVGSSSLKIRVRPSSSVTVACLTLDTGVLSTSLVRQCSPVKEMRSFSLHNRKKSTSPVKDAMSSPETEVRSFSLNSRVSPSSPATEASSTLDTSLVRQCSPVKEVQPSSLHRGKKKTSLVKETESSSDTEVRSSLLHRGKNTTSLVKAAKSLPGKEAWSSSLKTKMKKSSSVTGGSLTLDTGVMLTSLGRQPSPFKEVRSSSLHRGKKKTPAVSETVSSPDSEAQSSSLNSEARPSSPLTEESSILDTAVMSSLEKQSSSVKKVRSTSLKRGKKKTSFVKVARSSPDTEVRSSSLKTRKRQSSPVAEAKSSSDTKVRSSSPDIEIRSYSPDTCASLSRTESQRPFTEIAEDRATTEITSSNTEMPKRLTLPPSTWLKDRSALDQSCANQNTDDRVEPMLTSSSDKDSKIEGICSEVVTVITDEEDTSTVDSQQLSKSVVNSAASSGINESSSRVMTELLVLSEREEEVKHEKMSLDLRLSRLHKFLEQTVVQINRCTDRRKQLHDEEQELTTQRLTLLRAILSTSEASRFTCDGQSQAPISDQPGLQSSVPAPSIKSVSYTALGQVRSSTSSITETSRVTSSSDENPQGTTLSRADWLAKFSSFLPHDPAREESQVTVVSRTDVNERMHLPSIPGSSLNSSLPSDKNVNIKNLETCVKFLSKPACVTDQPFQMLSKETDGNDDVLHPLMSSNEGLVVTSSTAATANKQMTNNLMPAPIMYLGSFRSADADLSASVQAENLTE